MDYKKAFHIAYLRQQGLAYTESNLVYSVDDENLELLKETDTHWITLHSDIQAGDFLNAVNKKTFDLETIELVYKN